MFKCQICTKPPPASSSTNSVMLTVSVKTDLYLQLRIKNRFKQNVLVSKAHRDYRAKSSLHLSAQHNAVGNLRGWCHHHALNSFLMFQLLSRIWNLIGVYEKRKCEMWWKEGESQREGLLLVLMMLLHCSAVMAGASKTSSSHPCQRSVSCIPSFHPQRTIVLISTCLINDPVLLPRSILLHICLPHLAEYSAKTAVKTFFCFI